MAGRRNRRRGVAGRRKRRRGVGGDTARVRSGCSDRGDRPPLGRVDGSLVLRTAAVGRRDRGPGDRLRRRRAARAPRGRRQRSGDARSRRHHRGLGGRFVVRARSGLAGETSGIHADSFSTKPVIAFVYLVLVGSLIAFSAYAWLLKNVRISVVATYAFVNPVVAVALGTVFL